MTPETVIGALLGVLGALLAAVFKMHRDQIRDLREKRAADRKALQHDIAILRHHVDGLDKFFLEWRHKTYQPAISGLQLDSEKLKEKVGQLEKWRNHER